MNETHILGASREALQFLDSNCDENDLYQVDKMSQEETKEKLK